MRILGVLLLCVACGSSGGGDSDKEPAADTDGTTEGGETESPDQYAKLVNAPADLPTCDAAHEGALVYVKDADKFQSCAAGAWTDVPIGQGDTFTCQGVLGVSPEIPYFYELRKDAGRVRVYAEINGTSRTVSWKETPEDHFLELNGMCKETDCPTFRIKILSKKLRIEEGSNVYDIASDDCETIGAPL